MPTRFKGSAADTVTSSPLASANRLRFARKLSSACGSANCSPRYPETNRPPRTSPRSSILRRQIKISRQFGRFASRVVTSRKTTPYLASNIRVVDVTAFSRCSIVGFASSGCHSADHLPAPCPRLRCGPVRRPRSMISRRLSQPSPVTNPAETSSQSASSTLSFDSPQLRTRSAVNCAPRLVNLANTARASSLRQLCNESIRSAGENACACIQSQSLRTKNVRGATLDGTIRRACPPPSTSTAGCGDNRPHPIAPVKHRWSSASGS